jgi:hypothetical protein
VRIFSKGSFVRKGAKWLSVIALLAFNRPGLRAQMGAVPASAGTTAQQLIAHGPATKLTDTAVAMRQPAETRRPQSHRFPGWHSARKRGPDFLKQFLRPKANVVIPVTKSGGPPTRREGIPATGLQTTQFALTPNALPGFDFRKSLPADFLPTGVAVGDINGDGKEDWVVSNGGSNDVWVYLGQGDGTASLPTVVPLAGQSPVAVALADLRGNGILDLVVAEADSSTVEVLLGKGDGTFGAGTLYQTPDPPSTLVLANFHGNGHLDVAVGMDDLNSIDPKVYEDAIVLFPGDGSGKLSSPIVWANVNAVPDVTGLAVADLNGDGLPDLVVLEGFGGAPGIYALLSQGDGTFKQSYFDSHVPGVVNFDAIAMGDLNEDGHADLVIVDSDGNASIATGNGDGTFSSASTWKVFGTGDTGFSAALVDLNGDGHLDLVTSSATVIGDQSLGLNAGDLVCVLLGDGQGNLSPANVYRGESGMFSLAVADLNGDGRPEVITANQDSDSVTVYLNDGRGGFGDPSGGYIGYIAGSKSSGGVLNAPFSNFQFLDVNGDGKPDLVLLEYGEVFPDPFQITVLLNDGTGHFGKPIRSPGVTGGFEVGDLVFGDFRNTGHRDFLSVDLEYSGNPFLAFAANNGDGTFAAPSITQPPTAEGILASGDFNGDGNLDFVVAGLSNQANPSSQLVVLLGHGDGTFTLGPIYTFDTTGASTAPALIYVGDFNHDGKLDVLVWDNGSLEGSANYNLYEFLGHGDGTFSPPKVVISNLGTFTLIDLNHDGMPDVVELVQSSPVSIGPPQFNIYMGKVDGSFEFANSYSPYVGQFGSFFIFGKGGLFPGAGPLVADFNGDGIPDIAAFQAPVGTGEAVVQFLLGNGDGTFTPSFSTFHFGNRFAPQHAFDVDGDGRADLVELDGYASAYNILRSVPGPAFQMRMKADPVIGSNGGVTISLALPATGPTTITLTASDPAISIPVAVTIPAGELTQDVSFLVGNTFNLAHVFSIQAQLGGESEIVYGSQSSLAGLLFTTGVASTESAFPGGSTPDFGFVASSAGGYSSTLAISCQGLPVGATCQFGENPLPLEAGLFATSTLIVNVNAGVAEGSYPFSVVASDGALTVTASTTLLVGDFQLSIMPATATTISGDSMTYTVPVLSIGGYSQPVIFACTTAAAGATCSTASRSAVPQSPPFGEPLSVQVSSLPIGTYSFTVTGTSGPFTHSAVGQFNVGDFSGSISQTAYTVSVGSQAAPVVTINSTNGLAGQVMLNCPSPPPGIGCSFSNEFPTLPANGSIASTLTISVFSKPSASAGSPVGFPNAPRGLLIVLFVLAFLRLVIETKKSESIAVRFAARAVLLVCLTVALTNCGAGNGDSGGGGTGNSGDGGNGGTGRGGTSVTVAVPVTATFSNETKTIGTVNVTVP